MNWAGEPPQPTEIPASVAKGDVPQDSDVSVIRVKAV